MSVLILALKDLSGRVATLEERSAPLQAKTKTKTEEECAGGKGARSGGGRWRRATSRGGGGRRVDPSGGGSEGGAMTGKSGASGGQSSARGAVRELSTCEAGGGEEEQMWVEEGGCGGRDGLVSEEQGHARSSPRG